MDQPSQRREDTCWSCSVLQTPLTSCSCSVLGLVDWDWIYKLLILSSSLILTGILTRSVHLSLCCTSLFVSVCQYVCVYLHPISNIVELFDVLLYCFLVYNEIGCVDLSYQSWWGHFVFVVVNRTFRHKTELIGLARPVRCVCCVSVQFRVLKRRFLQLLDIS